MRINFRKAKAKNFQSYGNCEIELRYDTDPFTLITGKNGAGKSTLLVDLLCFAFYGKVIRKGVTLSTIINNVNKKACKVELEFDIDSRKTYKIIRGLKPDILELYEKIDDKWQKHELESSKKLIQNQINDIIKIDIATLTNICIMTIDNRKPFVDLSPEETRNITETLFGIIIFSDMIKDFKEQNKSNKETLKINIKDLELYKELAKDGITKLKEFEKLKENFQEEKDKKLDLLNTDKEAKTKEHVAKTKEIEKIKEKYEAQDFESKIKILEEQIATDKDLNHQHEGDIKANMALIANETKKLELIKNSDECPTCNEIFTAEKKEKEISSIETLIHDYDKENDISLKKKAKINTEITIKQNQLTDIKDDQYHLEKKLTLAEKEIDILKRDLDDIINKIKVQENDNIDDKISNLIDRKKIEEHKTKYKNLKIENDQLIEKSKYVNLSLEVLPKIKKDIIKKDIPYLNSLIVSYMKEFQKSFAIQFDEEFKVSLKGFSKKGLGFYNLSSGEKKRLDLVILLSFIDLIKRKNSVSTNILVFDEIFSSSLDFDGAEILIDLLTKKINEGAIDNIFVISHDRNLQLPNARKMEIYKDGNFSKIRYES